MAVKRFPSRLMRIQALGIAAGRYALLAGDEGGPVEASRASHAAVAPAVRLRWPASPRSRPTNPCGFTADGAWCCAGFTARNIALLSALRVSRTIKPALETGSGRVRLCT